MDAIQLSQDQVSAALRSAPRASHPGPDGLRFEHLRQLSLSTPDILQTLTKFINNLITGKGAPKWYYLLMSSGCMIALAKPGSTDVRPIAMGGTLSKLISRTIQRSKQKAFDAVFRPTQYGVGLRRGTETIFHYTREALSRNPNWILIKIDFHNAFNEVHRQAILEAMLIYFPELYSWVKSRYQQKSYLWARDSIKGKSRYILSEEGVQQGDPLGPFLFALALHHFLLKEINKSIKEIGEGIALAYLDDIGLIGELTQ